MSSSANKEKKLKYLGVQFITIDDPVLEQSRMQLNGSRSNQSIRFNTKSSKNNIESPQPYPGFEKSNELFTRDEISQINYSLSLGSDSNNMFRFKPTSKLSLLREASQTINDKKNYADSLNSNASNDINFLEKDDKKVEILQKLDLPSTPSEGCDSLISSRIDDDASIIQDPMTNRKSIPNTPAEQRDSYSYLDDSKEGRNAAISQSEIQNQIWIYTHDTAASNMLEENLAEIVSSRSLPANNRQHKSSAITSINKNETSNIQKASNNDNNNHKDIINSNIINNTNINRNSNRQAKKKTQMYNFAYQSGTRIQPINGSIINGKTELNLNQGEKRLKNIIAMSSPKETITPEFSTPSILNKSYCARKITKYLQSTSVPLPTFLQEDFSEKVDD